MFAVPDQVSLPAAGPDLLHVPCTARILPALTLAWMTMSILNCYGTTIGIICCCHCDHSEGSDPGVPYTKVQIPILEIKGE